MNDSDKGAASENHAYRPIPDNEWRSLEEAAGIGFPHETKKLISESVARCLRARTRDRSGGFVRVAKSSVRRELYKVDTCVGALLKLSGQLEAVGFPIGGADSLRKVSDSPRWGIRCKRCDDRGHPFVLPINPYLAEILWCIDDQEKFLRASPSPPKCSFSTRRLLVRTTHHTRKLRVLLTVSEGAARYINAGPTDTAIVIKGAGCDETKDAAIALVWYHLNFALRRKRISQTDWPILLKLIKEAVTASKKETCGGERSNQRDFSREALIIQCATAFERAGGHVSLYYSGTRDLNKQTTGFIPLLCEVNRLLEEFGCAPADGDSAIAQAAQKLFKRAKLESAINLTFCTGD